MAAEAPLEGVGGKAAARRPLNKTAHPKHTEKAPALERRAALFPYVWESEKMACYASASLR